MKVSSSVCYSWLSRVLSNRAIKNQQLTKSIRQVFVSNHNIYGTRRIAKMLARSKIAANRKRIGRSYGAEGLLCKTKRRLKVTTNSKHNNPISPSGSKSGLIVGDKKSPKFFYYVYLLNRKDIIKREFGCSSKFTDNISWWIKTYHLYRPRKLLPKTSDLFFYA